MTIKSLESLIVKHKDTLMVNARWTDSSYGHVMSLYYHCKMTKSFQQIHGKG